ncbi:MAG: hypothetical protein AAB383_00165 [Patescibacteria group bacterium]
MHEQRTETDFNRIEAMVKAQYEPAKELIDRTRLSKGITVPSLQETIDILGEEASDEQIAEILKMQKAALILQPKKPFTDYVSAIDGNRKARHYPTYVPSFLKNRFAAMPSSNSVSLGFVEGLPELAGDPALMGRELEDQEMDVKRSLAIGVNIVNPRAYSLLQMAGMQSDNLVDQQNWSVVVEDDSKRSYLPKAGWDHVRVLFAEFSEGRELPLVRWRKAVMKERD